MANRYWNPAANADWGDANVWATTDGGDPTGVAEPTNSDDVFFSNTNSYKCTVSKQEVCKSLDFTYGTGFVGEFAGTAGGLSLYGSLTLNSGMNFSYTEGITFFSSSAQTITTNGKSLIGRIKLGNSLTLTLKDDLTTSGLILIGAGTLSAVDGDNNHIISAGSIEMTGTSYLTLGSATHLLTGTGTVFTGINITASTGTLKITDTSSTAITFKGEGKTYNNIWFSRGASTASNTITGSNTFADFKDDGTAAHSILFTAGTTQTVSTFTVTGTDGNVITLNQAAAGAQFNLSKASGTVKCDYLNISNSNATGGATWLAGSNSADTINNDGWIFADEIVSQITGVSTIQGVSTITL